MSTIKATTLSNLAGSKTVPTDTVVDGSAKAWVNFNGTGTVAIRRAFNVSSITDNGTGDYTVNFTNAMSDASYGICLTSDLKTTSSVPSSNGGYISALNRNAVPTASAFRIETTTPSALTDSFQVNAIVFS